MIIKPKVTEFNHRGTERTEDERMENYDYLGNNLLGFKLLFVEALRSLEAFSP